MMEARPFLHEAAATPIPAVLEPEESPLSPNILSKGSGDQLQQPPCAPRPENKRRRFVAIQQPYPSALFLPNLDGDEDVEDVDIMTTSSSTEMALLSTTRGRLYHQHPETRRSLGSSERMEVIRRGPRLRPLHSSSLSRVDTTTFKEGLRLGELVTRWRHAITTPMLGNGNGSTSSSVGRRNPSFTTPRQA